MKKLITISLVLIFGITSFSQSNSSNDISQQILDRHNYYRQQQGISNLVWSDQLAIDAQIWADSLAILNQMIHSDMEWGENIYYTTNLSSPNNPVDWWANEQQFYNGEAITAQNAHLFGHYTQIIWANTTYIGCAVAVSATGNYYWVCEYNPSGNYINQKPVDNYKKNNN